MNCSLPLRSPGPFFLSHAEPLAVRRKSLVVWRGLFPTQNKRVWLAFVLALCAPAGLRAQNSDTTAVVASQVQITGAAVVKPVRKPDQVITNDTIGLLAVRRAPRIVSPPALEPTAAPDESTPADVAAKRTAEIAALEKQIQDKQKRITLLMRLFVRDEQEFLKNPGGTADPAVEERRRYEQDELRWEAAEVAKLRAKVEELKGPKMEDGK